MKGRFVERNTNDVSPPHNIRSGVCARHPVPVVVCRHRLLCVTAVRCGRRVSVARLREGGQQNDGADVILLM